MGSSNNLTLSMLTPYQSVPIVIKIYPNYQSETPTLYDMNVTLVWTNAP
jgi:hypothetical protein